MPSSVPYAAGSSMPAKLVGCSRFSVTRTYCRVRAHSRLARSGCRAITTLTVQKERLYCKVRSVYAIHYTRYSRKPRGPSTGCENASKRPSLPHICPAMLLEQSACRPFHGLRLNRKGIALYLSTGALQWPAQSPLTASTARLTAVYAAVYHQERHSVNWLQGEARLVCPRGLETRPSWSQREKLCCASRDLTLSPAEALARACEDSAMWNAFTLLPRPAT